MLGTVVSDVFFFMWNECLSDIYKKRVKILLYLCNQFYLTCSYKLFRPWNICDILNVTWRDYDYLKKLFGYTFDK